MKRIVAIIVTLCLSVLLFACSSKTEEKQEERPEHISEEDWENAKNFIYLVDDVIDGIKDASNISTQIAIEVVIDKIDYSPLNIGASTLYLKAQQYSMGFISRHELIESRNNYAEMYGIKKREE